MKFQAKASFGSARWWFKSLITELAQAKNVNINQISQRLLLYILFNLFLYNFGQGVLQLQKSENPVLHRCLLPL